MLLTNFSSSLVRQVATLAGFFSLVSVGGVRAQIANDNTTKTVVETDRNVTNITGGIESGSNLFHSFREFSVETGATANFRHGNEIEQIFSRVTGGASEIDGLIRTEGDASLFLLNPAGVIFGNNAQLDIGGSFIVSTANSLIFADGTEFSATAPERESILTITSPVGLQYGNPAAIEIHTNNDRVVRDDADFGLTIYPETTLALLGGKVTVDRQSLNTIGGNAEIASIKSGEVAIATDEFGWQFDYQNVAEFGEINFDNSAVIESNGRVNFRGRAIRFAADSGIVDFNRFGEVESKINVTATESVEMNRGLLVTQVGAQIELLEAAITDAGGDIVIEAPQVTVKDGSVISAGTLSDGAGGSITINAAEELKLSAAENSNPSIISTSTGGVGDGGQIELNVGKLSLENGSQVQALGGFGSGGTITVNSAEEVLLSGTGTLRSQDRAGDETTVELASGLAASSGTAGLPPDQQPGGASGSLIVNTPKLSVEQSAEISVSNYGLANAGDIELNTDILNLNTSGQISANTASGAGGSIDILGRDLVMLDRSGVISTTAEGNGDGGNITLETGILALLDDNRISADASQGNGGNISIDALGLFTDPSSSITASSEVEQKQGDVAISTLDLDSRLSVDYIQSTVLDSSSQIVAGCGAGVDLDRDKFRNVGRGGIPQNPFREVSQTETLGDLGNSGAEALNVLNPTRFTSPEQPIVEAGSWTINSQGVVELVAATPKFIANTWCRANPTPG